MLWVLSLCGSAIRWMNGLVLFRLTGGLEEWAWEIRLRKCVTFPRAFGPGVCYLEASFAFDTGRRRFVIGRGDRKGLKGLLPLRVGGSLAPLLLRTVEEDRTIIEVAYSSQRQEN